jgi:signal transduction histidine kinase
VTSAIYLPGRDLRGAALACAVAAAAAATAAAIALATGQVRATSTALAVTTVIAGCTWVAGGITAWLRQPNNRTGPLMTITGFVLFASALAQANSALPFTVGLVVAAWPAALVGHLVLAFPDGRLHSRGERIVIGLAYLDVVVLQVLMLMFMGFEHVNGCPCPRNLLFVRDDMGLHSVLMGTERAVGFALAVAVFTMLVRRLRSASAPMRRAIVPVASTGLLTLGLYAISAATATSAPSLSRVFGAASGAALAIIPVAFLVGLFNARLARAGVSDLLTELERMPGPGQLREALARVLGDRSLDLVYWIPETETWVGIDGQPVDPYAEPERAVTVLDRGGRRIAALVHDPALRERRELLDAVSTAAGLSLENERLQAELRAQLDELTDSRARIVEAGDRARQRLERNLHDGAQQRFVALSMALGLMESRLRNDPEGAAELLSSAREDLRQGLEELRELARGLHPAVLTERGLAAALEALTAGSPVPVTILAIPEERLPENIEATAYFVVAEALTNVARYAGATRATVDIRCIDGKLVVEVRDDGIGGAEAGAGSGLRGLADRVAAVEGRLSVKSPQGAGTTVRAEMPCE